MFFRRKDTRRSGATVLVRMTLVTCMLLVANRVLAVSLYRVLVPASFDIPKVQTIVSVLAMIGLLLPEWWLIDWSTAKLKSLFRWLEAAQGQSDR
jgi:hypothetical protein